MTRRISGCSASCRSASSPPRQIVRKRGDLHRPPSCPVSASWKACFESFGLRPDIQRSSDLPTVDSHLCFSSATLASASCSIPFLPRCCTYMPSRLLEETRVRRFPRKCARKKRLRARPDPLSDRSCATSRLLFRSALLDRHLELDGTKEAFKRARGASGVDDNGTGPLG